MFFLPDYNEQNKVIHSLKSVDKPILSDIRQQNLKSKIFQRIRTHERPIEEENWATALIGLISEIAREIALPWSQQFFLREKILSMLPRKSWFTLFFQKPWIRAASGFTLAFFLLFVFSNIFFAPSVVEAKPSTVLLDVEGNVEILRNGKPIPATKQAKLHARDIIKTYEGSKATIRFVDDSVSRLSESTEIRIRKLFVHPLDFTRTVVELELIRGILYSRVISLVDETSKFQVRTASTVLTTKKPAAFTVELKDKGKAEVTVVKNTVDVTVTDKQKQVVETTLLNGYQLNIQQGKATTVTQRKDLEQEWISQNLTEDKVYLEELKTEKSEERAKKDRSPNGLSSLLVFHPIEKGREKLRVAEAKLIQAEVLLRANFSENATTLLDEFSSIFSEISQKISELEKQDPAKAAELRTNLDRALKYYKKQFTVLLPDDPLYPLKETIANAELSLAKGPVEEVEKRLEQASDKLLEVQTLAAEGKSDLAADQLEAFQVTATTTATEATTPPEGFDASIQQELVSTILTGKTDHLKLLEAISAEIQFITPPALPPKARRAISLQELIANVKKDSLTELGETLATVAASGEPSVETLKQVEEIKKLEVNLTPLVSGVTLDEGKTIIEGTGAVTDERTIETETTISESQTITREIKSDPIAGVTVITIEAKPSAQVESTAEPTLLPEDSGIQEPLPAQP